MKRCSWGTSEMQCKKTTTLNSLAWQKLNIVIISSVDEERKKQELWVMMTTSLDNNLVICSKAEDKHSLGYSIESLTPMYN